MQTIQLQSVEDFSALTPDAAVSLLHQTLVDNLAVIEQDLIPDLSHISHFASYAGGMSIEHIEFVRENRFRLCYAVPWDMSWSCAGQTESGIAKEKIHFTVSDDGQLNFISLKTS